MQSTRRTLQEDTLTLPENLNVHPNADDLSIEQPVVNVPKLIPKGEPGWLEQQALRFTETKEGILIKGEPGTGKRYYAHLIHSKSAQGRSGEFVQISALTGEDELKAVLFNEERKRCEGMLGRSVPCLDPRSTVFVNHIHELSFLSQTRIARFLMQNTSWSPSREARVRVIASTSLPRPNEKAHLVKSLDEQICQFRILEIPPLRDRKEDISAIVASLLKRISSERGGKRLALKSDTLNQLIGHEWRDNVRELRAVLEDATRSSRNGSLVLPATFFDDVERVKETIGALQTGKVIRVDDVLSAVEKTLIQRALMRWGFNLARTARVLGLTEQNLRYRIRKYDLHLPPVQKRK